MKKFAGPLTMTPPTQGVTSSGNAKGEGRPPASPPLPGSGPAPRLPHHLFTLPSEPASEWGSRQASNWLSSALLGSSAVKLAWATNNKGGCPTVDWQWLVGVACTCPSVQLSPTAGGPNAKADPAQQSWPELPPSRQPIPCTLYQIPQHHPRLDGPVYKWVSQDHCLLWEEVIYFNYFCIYLLLINFTGWHPPPRSCINETGSVLEPLVILLHLFSKPQIRLATLPSWWSPTQTVNISFI